MDTCRLTMDDVISALNEVDAARKALDDAVLELPNNSDMIIGSALSKAPISDLKYRSSSSAAHSKSNLVKQNAKKSNAFIATKTPYRERRAFGEKSLDTSFSDTSTQDDVTHLRNEMASLEKELKDARNNVAHVNSFFNDLKTKNQELETGVDSLLASKYELEADVKVLKSKLQSEHPRFIQDIMSPSSNGHGPTTPYPNAASKYDQSGFWHKSYDGPNETGLFIRKVKSDVLARSTRLAYSSFKREMKESARAKATAKKAQQGVTQREGIVSDTPFVPRRLDFATEYTHRKEDKNLLDDNIYRKNHVSADKVRHGVHLTADSTSFEPNGKTGLPKNPSVKKTPGIARKLNFESFYGEKNAI